MNSREREREREKKNEGGRFHTMHAATPLQKCFHKNKDTTNASIFC